MKKKIKILCTILLVGSGVAFWTGIAVSWQSRPVTVNNGPSAAATPSSSPLTGFAMNHLPLQFIENRGQTDPSVRYILRGPGHSVYLTDTGLIFDFLRIAKPDDEPRGHGPAAKSGRRLTVNLDLVGSSPRPRLTACDPKAARFHYLIGNDRSKWVTDVPAYGEVLYRDVYPAIDLRLYDDGGRLRYDFVVRPGGRVEDIELAFRGIDKLRLDKGELVASTEFGDMRQGRPLVYQNDLSGRTEVGGGFVLAGEERFGFAVGAYDRSRPLVIDPLVMTLGYSTFLGGSGDEQANDMVWSGDYYYVTGTTYSSGFPATTGAYDVVANGSADAFVAKIDPASSDAGSLVWCTFIGGSSVDVANGIDVHGDEAYIVGGTLSSDFPVANQGFLNYNDFEDVFVTRLNSTGSGLIASVCLGHTTPYTGNEWGNGISVASPTAVWICGITFSGLGFYPDADPAIRQVHGPLGAGDGFMVQVCMSTDPAYLADIMVFGGSGGDEAHAIEQNGSAIYMTGLTSSFSDFPVSAGAYQSTFQGSSSDAFVFKSDFGGSMLYSTYLGTSLPDAGTGISIGSGGAYVCGYCYDAFPVGFASNGWDSIRTHNPGYRGGFMAKIRDDGTAIDYATYIETDISTESTYPRDIKTGGSGSSLCWVTGDTNATLHGIPAKNYYQSHQGLKDAFVIRLDTSATGDDSCLFASNIGGGAMMKGGPWPGSSDRSR